MPTLGKLPSMETNRLTLAIQRQSFRIGSKQTSQTVISRNSHTFADRGQKLSNVAKGHSKCSEVYLYAVLGDKSQWDQRLNLQKDIFKIIIADLIFFWQINTFLYRYSEKKTVKSEVKISKKEKCSLIQIYSYSDLITLIFNSIYSILIRISKKDKFFNHSFSREFKSTIIILNFENLNSH